VFALLDSLGFQEMLVLLVIGLLLYGRNLPQAGRTLGRAWAQFRRGLHEFKTQMDQDADLRDAKNVLRSTMDEVRKVKEVPLAAMDPARALRDLTNEALSSPPPEPTAVQDRTTATQDDPPLAR